MLTATHWYNLYPRNLRRSYYVMLILCWATVFFIIGYGRVSANRAARRAAASDGGVAIIMPSDTIRYSEMAPPPSLSGGSVVAEAALPDAAPGSVEGVTSTIPLPVPDEQAEVATMATQSKVSGVAAPAASGSGAPVFIMPETTRQVFDDNKPAPVMVKYMKASVMPTPLKDVQPEYPEKARTMGFEGTAMIDMWLKKDGTVSVVQVYKSSGYPMLDTAAAKAASNSSFTPARGADGAPVNVWVRRPFRFSLSGGQR